jgi:trans-aconitate methyltransferase
VGFFDTEEGVEQYVEMAEGYDGAELIGVLREHLPEGSSVLELGMGPGVDLDILARTYVATGSDSSQVFLDRYRAAHPDADLLLLDARTLESARRFDAIYSNKVLHHLTREELRTSLEAQPGLLRPGGFAMHSLWWGEEDEEPMEGLLFTRYTEPELAEVVAGTGFEVVEMRRYTEMEPDDSVWVLLRKVSG